MSENRKYIYTERAHLMCPNMQFGIMFGVREKYDATKVRETLEILCDSHELLKSRVACEDNTGKMYYRYEKDSFVPVFEKNDSDNWKKDYDELTLCGWNTMAESLLKVIVYPGNETFRIILIAHHILCDGRGLLQLVNEFANCYVKGGRPDKVSEQLISSMDDMPKHSELPFMSKVIINDANKRWLKENHRVSYSEYLKFEKEFLSKNANEKVVESISEEEMNKIIDICKNNKVSVNDYLVAKMMIDKGTDKVIIAEDVRSELSCYKTGAIGNYATAYGVKVKIGSGDIGALAQRVSKQCKKIRSKKSAEFLVLACYALMNQELIDAVAISTLGNFSSEPGNFVGSNMFGFKKRNGYSVTNLGKISSDCIDDAIFIPPVSPANEEIWGVLTVNSVMKICKVTSK